MRNHVLRKLTQNTTAFHKRLLFVDSSTQQCTRGTVKLVPGEPNNFTHGAYCGVVPIETMRRSQFALLLGGDTAGTRREIECMQYGTLPLTLVDAVWNFALSFQCFVPYDMFTIRISQGRAEMDLPGALDEVASYGPARLQHMQDLMKYFRDDVMWMSDQSRVTDNLLLESQRRVMERRSMSTSVGYNLCLQ